MGRQLGELLSRLDAITTKLSGRSNKSMANKSKRTTKPKADRRSAGVRLKELKHRQTEDRLRRCDEMLTAAGVPEWVMNSENDNVPANSTPARLRWYLARRKDIKPGEVDQQLQREMINWMDYVAQT